MLFTDMINELKRSVCLSSQLVYLYDMLLGNWKMPYGLNRKTVGKEKNLGLSLPNKDTGYMRFKLCYHF
jgi:hypothetical protein